MPRRETLNDVIDNVLTEAGLDQPQEAVLEASSPEEKTAAVAKLRADKAFKTAASKDREIHNKLLKQDKVRIAISPMYAPYFGETMVVKLNGFPIYVPVNGRTYEIPKSYASIIQARIRGVNDMLNRGARMSDFKNNRETSPGELPIF